MEPRSNKLKRQTILDPFNCDSSSTFETTQYNVSSDKILSKGNPSWINKISKVVSQIDTKKYIDIASSAVKSIQDFTFDSSIKLDRVDYGVFDLPFDTSNIENSHKPIELYKFTEDDLQTINKLPENIIFDYVNLENEVFRIDDEITEFKFTNYIVTLNPHIYTVNSSTIACKESDNSDLFENTLSSKYNLQSKNHCDNVTKPIYWSIIADIEFTNYRIIIKPYVDNSSNNSTIIKYLISSGLISIYKGHIEKFIFKKTHTNDSTNVSTTEKSNLIILLKHCHKFKIFLQKKLDSNDLSETEKFFIAASNHSHVDNSIFYNIDSSNFEKYNQIEYISNNVSNSNTASANNYSHVNYDKLCFVVFDPELYYKQITNNMNNIFCMHNHDFSLCPTYPDKLPMGGLVFADDEIGQIAKFRSKARLPILSYRTKLASVWRSSQPNTSLKVNRCHYDENLVQYLLHPNQVETSHILDARPFTNAFISKIAGTGYEDVKNNYSTCNIEFAQIENIHKVAASYESLLKIIEKDSYIEINDIYNYLPQISRSKYLGLLLNTLCFDYQNALITAAYKIVYLMNNGHSVLIHCSDGWDRTAQLTSLACIIIDPIFRTIDGLIGLIEREFLWMGHKFPRRLGIYDYFSNQKSPIFVQFLDILLTIINLNSTKFEYTTNLIECIQYHTNSLLWGEWLFANHKERIEHLKQQPLIWRSLFRKIIVKKEVFINKNYVAFDGIIKNTASTHNFPKLNNYWIRYKPAYIFTKKN